MKDQTVNTVNTGDAVKGKLLTLKEASEFTGLSVQAIRMRLKRGKLEGVLSPHKHGSTWLIKQDSIRDLRGLELTTLNPVSTSHVILSQENPSQELTVSENALLKEKDEHLTTLKSQLKVYEKLLTDFQARINIIESDKCHLEYQLKRLPAPVETVSARLEELEQTLREERAARENMESDLLTERAKPWWKKLFRK